MWMRVNSTTNLIGNLGPCGPQLVWLCVLSWLRFGQHWSCLLYWHKAASYKFPLFRPSVFWWQILKWVCIVTPWAEVQGWGMLYLHDVFLIVPVQSLRLLFSDTKFFNNDVIFVYPACNFYRFKLLSTPHCIFVWFVLISLLSASVSQVNAVGSNYITVWRSHYLEISFARRISPLPFHSASFTFSEHG